MTIETILSEFEFSEDAACDALRDLWLSLAIEWRRKAMEVDCPARAVIWASAASNAYWNAAGNDAGLSFQDILDNAGIEGEEK